jgi:hypothetical protein
MKLYINICRIYHANVYPTGTQLHCGSVLCSAFRVKVVPPYLRLIRSKTYRGYVKLQIIPNAIYKVIFV